MSEESIREENSVPNSLGHRHITNGRDDDGSVPSIQLRCVSRSEYLVIFGLIAASPFFLVIGQSCRTGRDLSLPFLIGELIVLIMSIIIAVIGFRRRAVAFLGLGILSVLLSIGFSFFGTSGMLWCGVRDVEITLLVTDSKTGKPIEKAEITFFEYDDRRESIVTNENGMASLLRQCFSAGESSPVCDRGSVNFSGIKLVVMAAGYETLDIPFSRLAGHGLELHGPPLPPIALELTAKQN